MRKQTGKKRYVIILPIAVLLCVALLVAILLYKPELQQSLSNKPSSLQTYKDIGSLVFTRADDSQMTVSELNGKAAVLVYWTTWCPLCKDGLTRMNELAAAVLEEQDATLLLVNKFDSMENREEVVSFIKNNEIHAENIFDEDAAVFNEMGLSYLPTTLVIDPKGRLVFLCPGEIPQENKLVSLVRAAMSGGSSALLSFLENFMMDGGGIRTTYLDGSGELPSGSDVLSESQGLLMLYAAQSGNRELFEDAYSYVRGHLAGGGLAAWVTTTADGAYKTNALVDDLRIFRALHTANQSWGGYGEDLRELSDALYEYCTKDGQLVDFYDFKYNEQATRLTLCYADFQTLLLLSETDSRWAEVYENSLERVQAGRISENFPLYRSYFDYTKARYPAGELNMAEALLTLLHLSEAGRLPRESFEWLRLRVMEGTVYIRYDQYGKPTRDGYNESTAVYALCTLIALSENDEQMAQRAIALMSQMRINDATSAFDGAFGHSDGNGIFSFDQLTALLAFSQMEVRGQ